MMKLGFLEGHMNTQAWLNLLEKNPTELVQMSNLSLTLCEASTGLPNLMNTMPLCG